MKAVVKDTRPRPDELLEGELEDELHEAAPDKSMEMVAIPAGDFIMGTSDAQVRRLLLKEDWAKEWSDKQLFRIEQPQHRVYVAAFAISIVPVTNVEYHRFVWETGHRTPRYWVSFQFPEGQDDQPVVEVSMVDAKAYCAWLNKETGKVYRLPTEAEWEKSARGTDGRTYPWGTDFDPWRCNTLESGKRGTTPVGTYTPSGDSPFGVRDMAGNVWEWTSSLELPYPYKADDGREDPEGQGVRVIRGGAWYYSRKLARCAAREGVKPNYVSASVGFRLVLSLPEDPPKKPAGSV
jgi:toxoflavin biosynthesis protein ToxD